MWPVSRPSHNDRLKVSTFEPEWVRIGGLRRPAPNSLAFDS